MINKILLSILFFGLILLVFLVLMSFFKKPLRRFEFWLRQACGIFYCGRSPIGGVKGVVHEEVVLQASQVSQVGGCARPRAVKDKRGRSMILYEGPRGTIYLSRACEDLTPRLQLSATFLKTQAIYKASEKHGGQRRWIPLCSQQAPRLFLGPIKQIFHHFSLTSQIK